MERWLPENASGAEEEAELYILRYKSAGYTTQINKRNNVMKLEIEYDLINCMYVLNIHYEGISLFLYSGSANQTGLAISMLRRLVRNIDLSFANSVNPNMQSSILNCIH